MSETTATEKPPEDTVDAAAPAEPKPRAQVETPGWVWVVYALGVASATVFLGSLAIVVLAYATEGKNGDAGVHISAGPFVVWLGLMLAAIATFVRRRSGARR